MLNSSTPNFAAESGIEKGAMRRRRLAVTWLVLTSWIVYIEGKRCEINLVDHEPDFCWYISDPSKSLCCYADI